MRPKDSEQIVVNSDRPILFGIGSAQGDDQIGWIIADQLQERCIDRVEIWKTSIPLDVLDRIGQSTELHIVDACEGTKPPGYLYRWDWCHIAHHPVAEALLKPTSIQDPFVTRGSGTHDFDVVSVLKLAHKLEQLPESVTIWGIQGERFSDPGPISSVVACKLPNIVETIAKELIDARTIAGAITVDAG